MHTIIEITAEDENALEQRISAIETLCVSIDTLSKRCDFKQAQAFISCLPALSLDADIERKARRNALTDGAAAAFPFSPFEICDQNGIILGINQHNRSVAVVDIFDSAKYSNANMCIMGISGAGKTFLLQLMALRLRMQDTQIFIIAPLKGHEFRPACEAIGGKYIKSRFKIVMQLEGDEAYRVQKVLSLSDEETTQIIRNQRGQGLVCANRNRVSVEFRTSQKEYDTVTTNINNPSYYMTI